MHFSEPLIAWYQAHKRDLPWRALSDPYPIWLSEIILQQTRVDQGMAYWHKFMDHYPTVYDLAAADEDAVLKDWQGLGYYSRARNLHASAKYVVHECDGKFPNTFKGIQALKGVGKYTAAAIASFCFNEAVPVVDGNVYRVLARIFGIDTPIDSTGGAKEFFELASTLIDPNNPADFNQAIMEFGSLQCTPKSPNCGICPFRDKCVALEKGRIDQLPVKKNKIKQRHRYFTYLLLETDASILLNKRTQKDIWTNLYDFPMIESDQALLEEAVLEHETFKALTRPGAFEVKQISAPFKHILSHQIIWATFWNISVKAHTEAASTYLTINKEDLEQYAVPRLIERYLEGRTNNQQGELVFI